MAWTVPSRSRWTRCRRTRTESAGAGPAADGPGAANQRLKGDIEHPEGSRTSGPHYLTAERASTVNAPASEASVRKTMCPAVMEEGSVFPSEDSTVSPVAISRIL